MNNLVKLSAINEDIARVKQMLDEAKRTGIYEPIASKIISAI